MDFALQPRTPPGKRLMELTEAHAADFATRAAQHDREGSFPFENVNAMTQSGVMAACVPEAFGGLGVASVHDYVLGISRLARGDASTAIAANMHMVRPWRLTRLWNVATAQGGRHPAGRAPGAAVTPDWRWEHGHVRPLLGSWNRSAASLGTGDQG